MKTLLAVLALACPLALNAQLVTVTASHVVDASGNPLNGTINFRPSVPFRVTGSGQIISSPVSASVTNGVFSLSLADTSQSTPLNSCYVAWATDLNGNVVLGAKYSGLQATQQGYGCVQVSTSWCTSSVCNFDNYNPTGSPMAILQSGAPGANATITIGTVSTGTPAAVVNEGTSTNAILNFTIPAYTTPPIATTSVAGLVKAGTNLQVAGDGTLSVTPNVFDSYGLAASVLATSSQKANNLSDIVNPALARANLGAQATLTFTPENAGNKGQPNGYAPLGAGSLVPLTNLPTIPTTQISGLGTLATLNSLSVVNGTTFGASAAANQTVITSAIGVAGWVGVPACPDSGGQHLNFASGTLTCGTTGGTAGSATFSTLTGGTSTNSYVIGSGGTLVTSGSGSIIATGLTGSIPTSQVTGLGSAATTSASAYDVSGAAASAQSASAQKAANLGDLTNYVTARANLGIGTAGTMASSAFDTAGAASAVAAASLQTTNNLGDLGSAAAARINLGLGTAATQATTAFDAAGAATAALASAFHIPGANVVTVGTGMSSISAGASTCGTSTPCLLIVPSNYTTSDTIGGFSLDPNLPGAQGYSTASGNITVEDYRYSGARTATNNFGFHQSLNNSPNFWSYNYYSIIPQNNLVTPFYLNANFWDGGTNLQNSAVSGGYTNKSTMNGMTLNVLGAANGQTVGLGINVQNTGGGDRLGQNITVKCWGGMNAQADESCEGQDIRILMAFGPFAGTLTGSPTTGATAVTVNPTMLSGTQGPGRPLINLTHGVISAGHISAISSPGTGPTTLTGSGTSWPVSTAVAMTSADISAPGSGIVITPTSFSIGSISGFTTSGLACIADGNSFEHFYPSAVSGSTITATLRKIYKAPAYVTTGGVCGLQGDLTADDVTSATFPIIADGQLQGTSRFVWPMLYSTSATSAVMWTSAAGAWSQLVSRYNASTANGYVLYPGAEVISAQSGGGPSPTLTLEPNNVAWTSGDSVENTIHPAHAMKMGNNLVQFQYPATANFPVTGLGVTVNGPMQGNDIGLGITNNGPAAMYTVNGGTYTAPRGILFQGLFNTGVQFSTGPSGPLIASGCQTPSCANSFAVWEQAGTAAGGTLDRVFRDEALGQWIFQTHGGGNALAMGWTASGGGQSYVGPFSDGAGFFGAVGHGAQGLYLANETSCATYSGGICLYSNAGVPHIVGPTGTDTAFGSGGGGTSGNATSIQGTPVSTTAPTAGQALVDISVSGTSTYVPTTLTPLSATGNGIAVVTTSGAAQVNLARLIRSVTTGTDALIPADCGNEVTYSYSSAIAIALSSPGLSGNFVNCPITLRNYGAGTATFTFSGGTIGGASTLQLTTNQSAEITPNTTSGEYDLGVTGGGGSSVWSALTAPTANLTLSMAAYMSTFTYGAATGSANMFTIQDTTANTGTGYVFTAGTQSGSAAKAFQVLTGGTQTFWTDQYGGTHAPSLTSTTVNVQQIISASSATFACSTGAGTSPTCGGAGSNLDGAFSFTTGTSPSASATVQTATFGYTYPTAPSCVLFPGNAASAALSGNSSIYVTTTTTAAVIHSGSTALAASTAYTWNYHCAN